MIVGPDGAPWVTDGGLNAIVRVDPRTLAVRALPAARRPARREPQHGDVRPRSAGSGSPARAGCTGASTRARGGCARSARRAASGRTGSRRPATGRSGTPRSPGATSRASTRRPARARVVQPPTAGQGARRIWPDSRGRLWVSEFNAGQARALRPARRAGGASGSCPASDPHPYAVFVDARDTVWLTDFGEDRLLRFDPRDRAASSRSGSRPAQAAVRQLLGREGRGLGGRVGRGQAGAPA